MPQSTPQGNAPKQMAGYAIYTASYTYSNGCPLFTDNDRATSRRLHVLRVSNLNPFDFNKVNNAPSLAREIRLLL